MRARAPGAAAGMPADIPQRVADRPGPASLALPRSRPEVDAPTSRRLVWSSLLALAIAAAARMLCPRWLGVPMDLVQAVAAAAVGCAAILTHWDELRAPRPLKLGTAAGIAVAGATAALGVALPEDGIGRVLAAALLAVAVITLNLPLGAAFLASIPPGRRGTAALDGLIVMGAATAVLTPVWFTAAAGPTSDLVFKTEAALGTGLVAWPVAGLLAVADQRLPPGLWGPWASLLGTVAGGVAILAWLSVYSEGQAAVPGLVALAASVSNLLLAWGVVSWQRVPPAQRWWPSVAQLIVDIFAVCAVATGLALAMPLSGTGGPAARLSAMAVVGLALVRQVHLVRRERGAAERELTTAARLTREIRRRASMMGWLAALEPQATLEATAERICEGMSSVDGVDEVEIVAFEPDGTSRIIGEAGPVRIARQLGEVQPVEMTRYYLARAAGGPWTEPLRHRPDPYAMLLLGGGLEWVTDVPIVHGDTMLGRLSIASAGTGDPELRHERLVTASELGAITSAVLGPPLAERVRLQVARREIEQVIEDWAFRTVFQPIVELPGHRTVGHEALTRFEDGTRPDARFLEASQVGLGRALEAATLESAVRAAGRIPRETYLSLNASPDLAQDVDAIARLIERAACPVVIEITEHAAVESYERLRESFATLRRLALIAVDDVGAGYAGLRHIVEIAPDLLKLDIALVRGVDRDPAKRALIGAMVTFARDTGCRVVAEGIETSEEEVALVDLGVPLGQGFRFGRPDRLDQIAVDGWLHDGSGPHELCN
jgi:EAL domain-containing protein (putative c-di-GMP-specific phosphodiesterase class I)